MTHVAAALLIALALLAPPGPALAQSSDEIQALKRSVEALRESQQRIEKELREIKDLLRARTGAQAPPDEPPKDLVLAIDGPVKGDKGARLVLVDFSDYQ